MRRVPHPVAIITSTDPSPSTTQPHTSSTDAYQTSHFRGMTVSSFNTVTLTPEPVVSFNVRRPSETLNALLSSGRFLVHLLAPNPATAALARDFARGNQRLASAGASGDGEGMSGFQFVGVRPFHGSGGPGQEGEGEGASASVRSLPLPLPMLRERNDASAEKPGAEAEAESSFFPFIFECRLLRESVTEVYDHTIVVGTIVRAITSGDFAGEITSKDLCLTYANTKFYGVGDEVA
ncbi:flavin reductase family protein [Aspergillus undulatus]|uniref:flavin reductase family protein n=1 Tax=Aspergillus undulatus TaxID=1810928 RepID=UPI003CCD2102